jgi:hypothetical protein
MCELCRKIQRENSERAAQELEKKNRAGAIAEPIKAISETTMTAIPRQYLILKVKDRHFLLEKQFIPDAEHCVLRKAINETDILIKDDFSPKAMQQVISVLQNDQTVEKQSLTWEDVQNIIAILDTLKIPKQYPEDLPKFPISPTYNTIFWQRYPVNDCCQITTLASLFLIDEKTVSCTMWYIESNKEFVICGIFNYTFIDTDHIQVTVKAASKLETASTLEIKLIKDNNYELTYVCPVGKCKKHSPLSGNQIRYKGVLKLAPNRSINYVDSPFKSNT